MESNLLDLLRAPEGAHLASHNGRIYLAQLTRSDPLRASFEIFPLGSAPSVDDLVGWLDRLGLMPELDSLRELVEQLQLDLDTMHDIHADSLASSSETIIELREQLETQLRLATENGLAHQQINNERMEERRQKIAALARCDELEEEKADLEAEISSRRFRLEELFKERDGYVDQVENLRQQLAAALNQSHQARNDLQARIFQVDELKQEAKSLREHLAEDKDIRQQLVVMEKERDALVDQVNALRQQLAGSDGKKVCSVCGVAKSFAEFGPHAKTRDHLASLCRDCDRIRKRTIRENERNEPELEPYKNDQKGYSCSVCPGLHYADAGYFRRHINIVHGGQLPPLSGVRPEMIASMVPASAQEVAPEAPFAQSQEAA